jgi:hypothetical protein
MVVPEELKDKSQFRVLKDNEYLMPVLELYTMTGKFKVAASTTFYLMVNQVLNKLVGWFYKKL